MLLSASSPVILGHTCSNDGVPHGNLAVIVMIATVGIYYWLTYALFDYAKMIDYAKKGLKMSD